MSENELPRLKPEPGKIVVECPKCNRLVSETCCAFQDFDYYKNCYEYLIFIDPNQIGRPPKPGVR